MAVSDVRVGRPACSLRRGSSWISHDVFLRGRRWRLLSSPALSRVLPASNRQCLLAWAQLRSRSCSSTLGKRELHCVGLPFTVNSRTGFLLGSLTALVIALLGQSVISALSEDPHPPRGAKGIAKSFQTLRTSSERMSKVEERWILRTLKPYEPSPVLLKSYPRHTNQGTIRVVITKSLLCLVQPRGTACASKQKATKLGVILGVFRPPNKHHRAPHDFLVQGVVPDGVSHALVVVDHRQYRTIDVKNNYFSVSADKPVHVKRLLRH
jgi:hypothetical protein